MNPKILLLDVETSPNLAYVWGLFKQNIGIHDLVDSSYVMCWSAKWLGEEEVLFDSMVASTHKRMLQRIHKLLDNADAVVHYNGSRFDMPVLNKEFIKHDMPPPSPYKNIDLLSTARRKFRFVSNKLDYVAQYLGLGGKVKHPGMQLWIKCMAKDKEAWEIMEKYNKQDVVLLEQVYDRFLPWIPNHINRSLFCDSVVCPNCGSGDHQKRGYHYTQAGKYQRYNCKGCGNWFKAGSTLAQPPANKATNV